MTFVWWLDYEKKDLRVEVPAGFVTNFASIPRYFWWLFNPTGYVAYILHDYLYSLEGKILANDSQSIIFTRKDADEILRQALIVEGCSKISAYLQYLAVRIFGSPQYKK